jgi:hypothetical protein
MKQITRSLLVVALAATTLLATAPAAQAFSLDLSTNWKMGDYISVTDSSGGVDGSIAARFPNYTNGGVAWTAGSFERSGVNFQLGFGLGPADRIAPYFGFGMNRVSYKNDYLVDLDGDGEDDQLLDQGAATQIGIEAGFRGFLADRGHSLAAPYLRFSFTKYIGLIDEFVEGQNNVDFYGDVLCAEIEASSCGEDFEKFDESILSPQGFKVAFGAEYYFNDNFAIGADLLGVEIFWSSATTKQDDHRLASYVSIALYSTLNISYRVIPKKRARKDKSTYDSDYDFDYED